MKTFTLELYACLRRPDPGLGTFKNAGNGFGVLWVWEFRVYRVLGFRICRFLGS